MPDVPPSSSLARDHLANERTFLAWIRTCLGVIGLGFAIARFGSWLRAMEVLPERLAAGGGSGRSLHIGVLMIVSGGLFSLIAAVRYRLVSRQIEQGTVRPAGMAIIAVTIFTLLLSAAIVWLTLRQA